MNILKTIGDRLLAKLLPAVKAGACIPEQGATCCKTHGHLNCTGHCV